MREAPRLPFGPYVSDVYTGIDTARMRVDRAARVRKTMHAHGATSLLVSGSNNVRYLTGFWAFDFQPQVCYTLFFADETLAPIVFSPAGSYQQMPDLVPWIEQLRIARTWMGGLPGSTASKNEAEKFAVEIKNLLDERHLGAEPLSVADLDRLGVEALAFVGLTVRDGTDMVLEASEIKTVDEIRCLQMAATLSNAGLQAGLDAIRPGVSQVDVARAMEHAMSRAGAEIVRAKCLTGPLSFERGISNVNRLIEHGDVGYIWTCGTSYMGYTGCVYRSIFVGQKVPDPYRSWYRELKDRVDNVFDAIKPGGSTEEAARRLPPASKWGYTSELEVLTVEFGHGIGLFNIGSRHIHYNWPIISRQWSLDHPQQFKVGQVVAVECLEGEHRLGGVRLENMALITDDGPVRLDTFPCDDVLVPSR